MIEIAGNEQISLEQINAVLIGQGVKVGAAKSQIRLRYLENLLLTQFPELSWVGASIKGVLMRVEVVERTSPNLAEAVW